MGGATDDIGGLGRLEQLVLRGDGLTTTSLEILTGHRIAVEVGGHWTITVPDGGAATTSTMHAELGAPGVQERLETALAATSRVPGRTYVMRMSSDGSPPAVLTERFAPHVFVPAPRRAG